MCSRLLGTSMEISHARIWGFRDFRGPSPCVDCSTRLSVPSAEDQCVFPSPDSSPFGRQRRGGAAAGTGRVWGSRKHRSFTGRGASVVAAELYLFVCSVLRRGDQPKVSPTRQRMQSGSSHSTTALWGVSPFVIAT